jgi:hypothetical protein
MAATARCLLFALLMVAGGPIADARAAAEAPAGAPDLLPSSTAMSSPVPPTVALKGRDRFVDPQDGVLDLSYILENPRGFLPVLLVVTEPAVGYGGGVAARFLQPREEAGETGWPRADVSGIGGLATENGTWAAFACDASRWLGDRLRPLAGAGPGQANLDFYGLGAVPASTPRRHRSTSCCNRTSATMPARGAVTPAIRGRSARPRRGPRCLHCAHDRKSRRRVPDGPRGGSHGPQDVTVLSLTPVKLHHGQCP